MPGDLGYAVEKYYGAMLTLAVSPEPLRVRLVEAYARSAIAIDPDKPGGKFPIPEELVERLREFREFMTWREPEESEGTIQATVNAMSDEQVSEAATTICELYSALSTENHRAWAGRHQTSPN